MSATPWPYEYGCHVHHLGDRAWGVFTPVSSGCRMVGRFGGEKGEAHARFMAESLDACHAIDCPPADLEPRVRRLLEAVRDGFRAMSALRSFVALDATRDPVRLACLQAADVAATKLDRALAEWRAL